MAKKQQDRARERRSHKRAVDAGLGKKSVSGALAEEAIEEAFDWLERGGLRRLWTVLKLVALILTILIALAVMYFLKYA